LHKIRLRAQQVELLYEDNQGDEGAQATDAGTDPMHDFEPHGGSDIILAGDQRRQHEANRKPNHQTDCQKHRGRPFHGRPSLSSTAAHPSVNEPYSARRLWPRRSFPGIQIDRQLAAKVVQHFAPIPAKNSVSTKKTAKKKTAKTNSEKLSGKWESA
jgi:hypothetical protein